MKPVYVLQTEPWERVATPPIPKVNFLSEAFCSNSRLERSCGFPHDPAVIKPMVKTMAKNHWNRGKAYLSEETEHGPKPPTLKRPDSELVHELQISEGSYLPDRWTSVLITLAEELWRTSSRITLRPWNCPIDGYISTQQRCLLLT